MLSIVDVLTNTPTISDTLRWVFSKPIFAEVMKQHDGSDVMSFSDCLTSSLSQGVLKRGFLDISLTKYFGISKFENT